MTRTWMRSSLVAAAALLVLSLAVRAPWFVEPPGRDQSLFMTQGLLLLEGHRLYADIWEHKPPGIILINAVALALFGKSYASIHVANWFAGWITSLGIGLLALRLGGKTVAAMTAAALYLIFYSGLAFGGFWSIAQAEVFIDPLCVAAAILLSREKGGLRHAVVAGGCLGFAVLLKYSALPLIAMGLLLFQEERVLGGSRWSRPAAFCAGVALPAGALVFYLTAAGALQEFWQATVSFNVLHVGTSSVSRLEGVLGKLFYEPGLLMPLYLLGGFAVAGVTFRRLRRRPHSGERLVRWALGLWGLAMLQVFWQSRFWIYHYEVVLPGLCLLAGAGGQQLVDWAARRSRWWIVSPAALLVLASFAPYASYATRYARDHDLPRRWGLDDADDRFRYHYRWGKDDYNFGENHRVAARINADTDPDQRIFVWGFEPGLYALSGRLPASRFLYDYPLMPRFESVHDIFTAQLMDDLKGHPPEVIVLYRNDANSVESLHSVAHLQQHPWLLEMVQQDYRLDWQLGDAYVFRRRIGDAIGGSEPPSRDLGSLRPR